MVQMSNRYLSKKTKTRKGISPVIATVILVAVAVVIAAALAGFSSSLFGSYSQNAQLSIHSLTITGGVANGDGSMEVVNTGGSSETIVSVAIQGYGSALASTSPVNTHVFGEAGSGNAPTIPANSEATISFIDLDDSGTATLVSGQTVTVTISTQSGQQFTLSTTVV